MRLTERVQLAALLLLLILGPTACAILTGTPAPPAHDPTLVACKSFTLFTWAPGDDQVALAILGEVRDGKRDLASPEKARQTLTQLREVLGDTTGTIMEIKPHNAAYRALCATPAPDAPQPAAPAPLQPAPH